MLRRFFFALMLAGVVGLSFDAVNAQEATPTAAPPASPSPSAKPSSTPTPPFNRLAWRSIGPAASGGRIASVVGSAKNPDLYYLGTAGGGVWKSVNGGATWSPTFDGQRVSSIGAVAIDPNDDDVVWAGTGETNPRNDVTYGDGIFKSIDGGKTWKNMGLRDTLQISSIAIDPRDSSAVTVGAMGDFFRDSKARGIYRTTDGGRSWTQALSVGPNSGVSDLAVDRKNPDVMYAGVWQFKRLPWTFMSGGPQDGIYKSTDAGKTWAKLKGNGLPTGDTGRIGLAVAPSDSNRVYALIESKGPGILWRSDDAGATWKVVSDDTLVDQRFFYFSHVAVDPSNADHVYGVSNELAESTDGGKKFKKIARGVHVDYHSMWIAPNDPKRMIVGEDGGYAITLDGGKNWSFSRNLAIGQVYHVGLDNETPYRVCASLQDNNGFCGPSNSLNGEGIPDAAWERVIGGDGMWAIPDPLDPNLVWTDLQTGRLTIYNRTTQRNTFIQPWIGIAADDFSLDKAAYRYNWDAPIGFAPWDGHIAWLGANVVFQTSDRGAHWKVISPDLTRNIKAHQQPAGGPLALDVSSAEFHDTLLDIEGSPIHKGEIWTGSDDGVISLTLDGGKHWRNVTPAGVPTEGRVETIAPSPLIDGVAYAVFDRHFSGDRTAYVYRTADHGAHWTSIASGLPAGQEARSIRPDAKNAHLVYLGLENSLMLSYDDGTHWASFQAGLPPVAVYDIRTQPRCNDLVIATHGRSLWIFDDLNAIQHFPAARSAGAMLFAPRTTYMFSEHSNDEGLYTRFAGKNPPSGTIVTFYQAKPGAKPPAVTILDAHQHVIRTIAGTHRIKEKEIPNVTNDTGLNRIAWDMREDGPVRWNGAAKEEFKGPRVGTTVVPGHYFVRMTLDGHTLEQPFTLEPDPRVSYTTADYAASYAFAKKHLDEFSQIDVALNRLDAAMKAHAGDAAYLAKAALVRGELTADFHNGEDFIQRPGRLREDMERLTYGSGAPPSIAQRQTADRIDAIYRKVMADVAAFFK